MKTHSCKYENFIEKYKFTDVKAEFNRLAVLAEVRQVFSIFTGEAGTLLNAVAELLNLPELKTIMFPGEYRLNFRYAENTTYIIGNNNDEKEISFEEFSEHIQETTGLDTSSSQFEGSVHLNNPLLKNIALTAVSISSGLDEELLFEADSCVLVLSATHFLSIKERNFIRENKIPRKVIIIRDIDKVHEDETEHVKSLISPYHDDSTLVFAQPLTDENCKTIFDHLTNIPDMVEKRINRIDACLKPTLIKSIEDLAEFKEKQAKSQRDITVHIKKAASNIADYRSKTARYVSSNYIDNIKTNTASYILNFYEKINQDIKIGIEEEKDLKNLQEELPNFIAGSWSEFVSNVLNGRVQENIDEVIPAIDAYIDDKVDLFLKDILTEGEYNKIKGIISKTINDKMVSLAYSDQLTGQSASLGKEGTGYRKILPKCLMALGGFVMFSSSFIPGALLLAAGITGERNAQKEFKEELIVAGKKLNHRYLKEVQDNLDKLIEQLNTEVLFVIERCYTAIAETLLDIIPEYEKLYNEAQVHIADFRNDIEVIKANN